MSWPVLDPAKDHQTLSILHLAAQMLGKIRVRHAPWTNHGWHVALQLNARGLATLPTASGDGRTFTLALDLCRHAIVLTTSAEEREELPLAAGSIAALHGDLVEMLRKYRLPSDFSGKPNEILDAVAFADDKAGASPESSAHSVHASAATFIVTPPRRAGRTRAPGSR